MSNNQKRTKAIILAIIGIIGIIVVFTIKPERKRWINNSGITWNTEYNIKYCHHTNLSDSIITVLREVELSVSPFNKKSRITAINENRSDTLDGYLSRLYDKSVEINRESGGAFDPTVSPLVNLWGFGYEKTGKANRQAVDSILMFVGIDKTRKEGIRIVKSDGRTTFNFSAIAKGMGCDEVGKMLERNGVTDYIVEIGGEITAKGHNPKGQKWRISIDKPINANDTVIHHSAGIVEITNCGIATSGNYRNYHTDSAGNKVAHTINPRTGMPEQSDVLSATVIAPDCMTADAYATTFMVLGLEKSKKLLDKHPEISAMLITSYNGNSFKIWESGNFPKMRQR
ncbi:MAG TPA: FAD:protein FMN transferase [Candidatus Limisoma gallistercoris]|nr:FAD:protein FMN transferase [Candidatus Limisoma gallistercoris]